VKQEISVQNRLERAFELLREKENEKALDVAKDLLEVNSENDRGWLLLGIANRRVGKFDEAIKCFQKATKLNPSMEEAWGLLSITYLDADQEAKAIESLSNAVECNPSCEELKFYEQNLIRIYKMFGPFF